MSLITPIPNGPFYSNPTNYINSPQGFLVVGSGLSVAPDGTLLVASALGGTVTQVNAGVGLSGGTITTIGTIDLVPATNSSLGGIKVGANLIVAPDGTLSALPPNPGTITSVTAGSGLTGGGAAGAVTLNLQPASTSTFGGVVINPVGGINVVGGQISIAQATTASIGGLAIATPAEVITGTDNTKAVTPLGLASKTASVLDPGIVRLSDSVALIDSTLASTPTATKIAYDAAVAAQNTANAALPLSGGTMTGIITFAAGQTFPGVAFPLATTLSPGVVQVGSGLSINSSGILSTSNVGTVTAVTAGPGLGSPASGNTISTSGTIRLLPPTTDGLELGGVKAGANVDIAFDGTISVPGTNFIASNNPFPFNGYIWPAALPAPSLPCPGSNGQVLTIIDNTTGQIGWTSSGTLSSVVAGTGITVSSTASTATISLTPTGVTAATVGGTGLIPTFQVNAQGQITSYGLANPYPPFQTATVTVPPNLVLDFADNNTNWEWTLNANIAIQTPSNLQSGQRGSLLIRQDPITIYNITWSTDWKFANGVAYTGPAGLNEVDILEFVVVAGNYIVVTDVVTNLL